MNDLPTREALIQQMAGLLSTVEFTPSTRHPSLMFGVAAQILGMIEDSGRLVDRDTIDYEAAAMAHARTLGDRLQPDGTPYPDVVIEVRVILDAALGEGEQ